jgi:cytochrome c oxidase subunit 2
MSTWLPPAASAHAADIDAVLTAVHLLMLALFVGWGGYFAWVLVRFRRGRQPVASHAGARGRLATATEVGVVVAETALLVGLALPIWFSRTAAQPEDRTALAVRVVAEQFAWQVHYPGADGEFGRTSIALVSDTNPLGLDRSSPDGADDLVVPGQLHLPVGRPVVIQLSSKDVIHSFGVTALRLKQDAIPGLLSPVWFTPTVEGEYEIACSQLCGLGHYRMKGVVTVESAEAFDAFLASEAQLQVR